MKKYASSLTPTLLFILLSLESLQPIVAKSHDTSFDILIFTQSWPVSICKEWKEKNPDHACAMPSKQNSFSIHGIWPTRLGSIGPAFCNSTWHFDPEQVKPIESTLEQLWINVEVGTSTYSFWAHEWTKHGTCAAVIPSLNSEFNYFSQGIKWLEQYMMTDTLADAGIKPSDDKEYSVSDISQTIKLKLGAHPMISCHKENGKHFLSEIRICFTKTLQLTNCDGIVTNNFYTEIINDQPIITNCGTSQGVIYPENLATVTQEPPHVSNTYIQLYYLTSWIQWITL